MNMPQTQPTIGPWEVSEKSPVLVIGYDPRLYPENERVTIARVDPGGDRLDAEIGEANARLIAASPELLRLLKLMAQESYAHERGQHGSICSCSSHRIEAKKLIASIEGE